MAAARCSAMQHDAANEIRERAHHDPRRGASQSACSVDRRTGRCQGRRVFPQSRPSLSVLRDHPEKRHSDGTCIIGNGRREEDAETGRPRRILIMLAQPSQSDPSGIQAAPLPTPGRGMTPDPPLEHLSLSAGSESARAATFFFAGTLMSTRNKPGSAWLAIVVLDERQTSAGLDRDRPGPGSGPIWGWGMMNDGSGDGQRIPSILYRIQYSTIRMPGRMEMQKLESGRCFLLLLETAHLDRPAVCWSL